MNRTEQQLQHLNDIRLPHEARLRMRENLAAYASLHSTPAAQAVRSPFHYFSMRLYAGLAAVALILVGVGGTAYASESALPGDSLYSVKVGIAEPLQGALVPSARGKAAWHAILAERRLEETAQLAARGSLSPNAQDELAANFTEQINASQNDADRLQHAGDTTGSLSARSDLEARLAAHQRILSVISDHFATATSSNAQATHQALERMLALVTTHEKDVTSSRIALEDALAPGTKHAGVKAKLAIAPRMSEQMHIEVTAAARTAEEETIFAKHAMMLAPFLEVSTTTSTTTVTTASTTTATSTDPDGTATTTEQTEIKNDVMQEDTTPPAGDEENISQ